ncbi:MAG: hypothetical protein Q8L68_01755 [Methylococcales bacterium]|nr:hypothetical protein [Methylococcales bacterium]
MSSKSDKNPFMLLLAGISLVADVLTLGQFIFSGNLFDFWSVRWIISLVFVFGFFWAGVGLLRLGQSPESAELAMSIFGMGYLIASLIVYIFLIFAQASGGLYPEDYLGFGVLLGVSYFFGNLALNFVGKENKKFPSYGYGLVSLLYAISLVMKYVFSGHFFYMEEFVAEIILVIVGGTIFIALYNSGNSSN